MRGDMARGNQRIRLKRRREETRGERRRDEEHRGEDWKNENVSECSVCRDEAKAESE